MSKNALGRFSGQLPDGDLWVFGYGSLMWNPGFPYIAQQPAFLHGYHRALCIYSKAHRGTPRDPGLVLGLAPGGSCHGMAFQVARGRVAETLLALWQREMRSPTYRPRLVQVSIAKRSTRALAFVADTTHRHYAGKLDVAEIARRVVRSRGQRGPNIEYVLNTAAHLGKLGVSDRRLAEVLAAVCALRGP